MTHHSWPEKPKTWPRIDGTISVHLTLLPAGAPRKRATISREINGYMAQYIAFDIRELDFSESRNMVQRLLYELFYRYQDMIFPESRILIHVEHWKGGLPQLCIEQHDWRTTAHGWMVKNGMHCNGEMAEQWIHEKVFRAIQDARSGLTITEEEWKEQLRLKEAQKEHRWAREWIRWTGLCWTWRLLPEEQVA